MFAMFERMFDSLQPALQLLQLLSFIIYVLAALATYVILGLALTALCRATGIGKVWMAWVPYANLYLPGLMADVYTDNRLTPPIERSLPFYAPSDLRRRMLGFGLGSTLTGAVAGAAMLFCLMMGAMAFFMLLGLAAGGDPSPNLPPFADVLFLVSGLVAFAGSIFCLIFTILFITASCTAYCRLFTALQAPLPALWGVLGILVPLIPAVVLLVYARRSDVSAAAFAPPSPEAEEGF